MPSLASLVRLAAATPLRRLPPPGRVDVRRGAARRCARSRRRCARAAARPTAAGGARLSRAASGCAGSRRRAPRSGSTARRSHSSRAGSAATSRPGAWPPRWSRTSCRGRRSTRSSSVPAVRDRAAAARRGPAGRAGGRAGALVGPAGRPARCGARAASVRSAGSMPTARRQQRARRIRGSRRPCAASRSSTTSTRPARRSTSAPARCARRAPGGARDHARAHAPRSDLCARAASWQTPTTRYPSGEARDAASGQR